MGQHCGQAFDEHRAGAGQVARARREAAADDHDAFSPDRGGLIDHPFVIVDRVLEFFAARSTEQTTAAIARHAQAMRAKNARGFRDTSLLHHLTPRSDARKAMAHSCLNGLRQLPLRAYGREVEGEVEPHVDRYPPKKSKSQPLSAWVTRSA